MKKPDKELKQEKIVLSKKEHEELKEKANQKDEAGDKYLRLYAEYENSRKMWTKQRQELLKFGNFRILKEFIVILDEIEAALSNAKEHSPDFNKGFEMIYKKMKEILLKEGLKLIEAQGKQFDPHLHEALFFEERDDLPEYTILEVIQQGYQYEDKVLRPTKVKVSLKPRIKDNKEEKAESQEEAQSKKEED